MDREATKGRNHFSDPRQTGDLNGSHQRLHPGINHGVNLVAKFNDQGTIP